MRCVGLLLGLACLAVAEDSTEAPVTDAADTSQGASEETTTTMPPIAADGSFSVCISNCAWATVNAAVCEEGAAVQAGDADDDATEAPADAGDADDEPSRRKREVEDGAEPEGGATEGDVAEVEGDEAVRDGCAAPDQMMGICLGSQKVDGVKAGQNLDLTYFKWLFSETKAPVIEISRDMAGKTIKLSGSFVSSIDWELTDDVCE